ANDQMTENPTVARRMLRRKSAGSPAAQPAARHAPVRWDFDPRHLLDAPEVNPEFRKVAKAALTEAVNQGLRPRVEYAYRSPQLQQTIMQKAPPGRPVATPFGSWHQY